MATDNLTPEGGKEGVVRGALRPQSPLPAYATTFSPTAKLRLAFQKIQETLVRSPEGRAP